MWHSDDLSLRDNLSTASNVTQMVAAPNHFLLAVCDANSGLAVYNTKRMRLLKTFYHSTKPISCMAFSPKGSFASGTDDGVIKLWSLRHEVE